MYAILAGFANFGMNVSRSVGVYLIERAGIKTSVSWRSSKSCATNAVRAPAQLKQALTVVLAPDMQGVQLWRLQTFDFLFMHVKP